MHAYVQSLKNLFEQNAHPEQAGPMAAYMRNQFRYLGIKTPESALLQKKNSTPRTVCLRCKNLTRLCTVCGICPNGNISMWRWAC